MDAVKGSEVNRILKMRLKPGIVLFITNHAPFGGYEKFIHDEFWELKKKLPNIVMVPFNPRENIVHNRVLFGKNDYLRQSLLNPLVYILGITGIILNPLKNISLLRRIIFNSNKKLNVLKNIIALVKANRFALGRNSGEIRFVYAHWATAPSTFGYFISVLLNVPFAFSCHRGDIEENNMLRVTAPHARFVRVISLAAQKRICELAKLDETKINFVLIRMGVRVPLTSSFSRNVKNKGKSILFPAFFNLVKGHIYAVEAIEILLKKRNDFILNCAGNGPVLDKIKRMVCDKKLEPFINFLGLVSGEKMIELIQESDMVILPSINDSCGNHEGIPVSLMEAMACKKPVISTKTGAISELVEDAGILIEEKNAALLAESINQLLDDGQLRNRLGEAGYKKVENEFNIRKTTHAVYELIEKYSK